jgi:ubiquinone biosynthesis protein
MAGQFLHDARRVVRLIALLARWGTSPLLRRVLHLGPSRLSFGVRIRRVIEGMGVTYTKLGQFLAMRFDILPPEVCRELDHLFERAPHLAPGLVRQLLEEELGVPREAAFASFDERPMAAASISQVHRAITRDGEPVAVKIQRPGIEAVFRSDVRLLLHLAALTDYLGWLGKIPAVELVEQFAAFTAQELDFGAEGRTADRVRKDITGMGVQVPRVRWDLSTQRVLTMELVEGVSLLSVCQLAESKGGAAVAEWLPDVDLLVFINTLANACLYQMFVSGLFHGDPHPGNILVTSSGTPVLVDFGIFGELGPGTRSLLARFYESLGQGDIPAAVRYYLDISRPTPETDLQAFRQQLAESLREWYELTLSQRGTVRERHPLRFVGDIIDVMRQNAVRMPPEQLLFWRALTTLASVALRLPVQFDLIAALRAFFEERRPSACERGADALAGFSWSRLQSVGQPVPRSLRTALRLTPTLQLQPRPPRRQRSDERRNVENLTLALVTISVTVAGAGIAQSTISFGLFVFVAASALTIVTRRMLRR